MAIGCFEVDTDYLRHTVADLRQYLQVLKNTHAELWDKMTEVSGMWEGPAKDAFHLQFKTDCAELIEVCKQIEDVLKSVDNAVKEYDACDDKIRSIIDAIRI